MRSQSPARCSAGLPGREFPRRAAQLTVSDQDRQPGSNPGGARGCLFRATRIQVQEQNASVSNNPVIGRQILWLGLGDPSKGKVWLRPGSKEQFVAELRECAECEDLWQEGRLEPTQWQQ